VDGKNSRPTHRDKAAMNGAQIYLFAMLRRVAGSVRATGHEQYDGAASTTTPREPEEFFEIESGGRQELAVHSSRRPRGYSDGAQTCPLMTNRTGAAFSASVHGGQFPFTFGNLEHTQIAQALACVALEDLGNIFGHSLISREES